MDWVISVLLISAAKIGTFSESTKLFAVFLPIGVVIVRGEDDDGCGHEFRLFLVPIEDGEEHLAHFFAEDEGFEDLDAVAVLEQLVKEI